MQGNEVQPTDRGREQGRKTIRSYTSTLLGLFIAGFVILASISFYLGTTADILTNYISYLIPALFIISIIGLFRYKRWGFYLLALYFIVNIIPYIIYLNYTSVIVLIVFAYLFLYKGFYKNLKYFD